MKVKRGLFVITLVVLFGFCYVIMNQHYDELARYPEKLNDSQRELVLEHLNTDEINTLISQKIKPDQFLPYITIEGFMLDNTLWYDEAYRNQKENVTPEFIVSFINKYKSNMKFGELDDLLLNYSFNALIRFFDEGDQYVANAKLIADPSDANTVLGKQETLYTYEPKDLVSIGTLPHDSILSDTYDVFVQKDVLKPLQELCSAASEVNGQTCGDMKIITGYLSYENQVKLLDKAKEKYEKDDFLKNWDYPGHSEFQLGYSIQLLPNELQATITNKEVEEKGETLSEEEKEQEIWLKDNAYKYGFIIRYPNNEEETTGKVHQPYTLRYVGRDIATQIHNKNIVLEEVDFSKFK